MSSDLTSEKYSRLAALRPARRARANATMSQESEPSARSTGDLEQLLGASVGRNRFGEHLLIQRWYPSPEPSFSAGDEHAQRALDLLLPGAPVKKIRSVPAVAHLAGDPSQWLFLDTETTGLAGGSGTYAFLVGLAWWDSGGLQVEQMFMRDFSEEHSLLQALDNRLAERRVLVTFNGKSFDWPLLETRFRMTRAIAPRVPLLHVDLLHPARQLWRPRLQSVRLAELERHVLHVSPGSKFDWTRDYDVDSSQIPEIYFNFVRTGSAAPLVPVIQHNQMDLRGLAALAGEVLQMLGGHSSLHKSAGSVEPLDLYGLSRLLGRRGEDALARKTCASALEAGLPGDHDRAARRDLARLAKRAGDTKGAIALWESLLSPTQPASKQIPIGDSPQSLTLERILMRKASGSHAFFAEESQLRAALEACEQLAIHFEHQIRELDPAVRVTRHGLSLIERARSAHPTDSFSHHKTFCRKWEERLAHRLARLERKNVQPARDDFTALERSATRD